MTRALEARPGPWVQGRRIINGHVIPVQIRGWAGGGGDHSIQFPGRSHANQNGARLRTGQGKTQGRLERIGLPLGNQAPGAGNSGRRRLEMTGGPVWRQEQEAIQED